jgi:hypothetical protein
VSLLPQTFSLSAAEIRTYYLNCERRGGAVDMATVYRLIDLEVGVRVPVRSRHFIPHMSRLALWPTQPPIQKVTWSLCAVVKRRGRESDHSSPTTAEVKKTLISTSTPPYVFMAWCLASYTAQEQILSYLYLYCKRRRGRTVCRPITWPWLAVCTNFRKTSTTQLYTSPSRLTL